MRKRVRMPSGPGGFLIAMLLCLAGPAAGTNRIALATQVDGDPISIFLYTPAGRGPFPFVILSHGSPRSGADRANFGANTLKSQAEALAAQGLAAAVVIRRGYGGQGRWAEAYGPCNQADYYAAGLASARDIAAAVALLSQQTQIDRRKLVLMGESAGGFASVAAASKMPVTGVVSFAGGRGSSGPDEVCDDAALINAMARYGATSRAPELWIYSANDHFFGPAMAHRLYEAFSKAGGRATFLGVPPYGEDGHTYVRAIDLWMPQVMAFLRQIGFVR